MKLIKEMPLSGTENGIITVGTIDEPYGKGSDSVASVAISLNGDTQEPDWKVHIPKNNIDGVIAALEEEKNSL